MDTRPMPGRRRRTCRVTRPSCDRCGFLPLSAPDSASARGDLPPIAVVACQHSPGCGARRGLRMPAGVRALDLPSGLVLLYGLSAQAGQRSGRPAQTPPIHSRRESAAIATRLRRKAACGTS